MRTDLYDCEGYEIFPGDRFRIGDRFYTAVLDNGMIMGVPSGWGANIPVEELCRDYTVYRILPEIWLKGIPDRMRHFFNHSELSESEKVIFKKLE